MTDCLVRNNCLKRYDCDWCRDYEEYTPQDRNIISPRQVLARKKRKEEAKAKKVSDPSKRGRANRRNGHKAEREVENLLKDMGLEASRTPLSGALKSSGLLPFFKNKLSGDIRVKYKGKELVVECKRDINTNAWYKLLDRGVVDIKGFCYGLRKELFEYLINGVHVGSIVEVEDKRFKKLHKYFDQDKSNIVVVTRPYHEPLFFLTEETYKLFRGN